MEYLYEKMIELGVEPFNLINTVYKYRTLEESIEIIKTNTIYFPTGEQLKNKDKNELSPFLINNFTEEQKNRYLREKIGPNLEHITTHELFDRMVSYFQNNAGIFCVGRSPLNRFLWDCFGKTNKGVCLGFDMQGILKRNFAFNVRYIDSENVVKTNIYDEEENDINYDVWQWFSTKFRSYSLEDEVRIIDQDNIGHIVFPKNCLVELIFGRGTTNDEQESVLKLLSEFQYPVRRIGYFNPEP